MLQWQWSRPGVLSLLLLAGLFLLFLSSGRLQTYGSMVSSSMTLPLVSNTATLLYAILSVLCLSLSRSRRFQKKMNEIIYLLIRFITVVLLILLSWTWYVFNSAWIGKQVLLKDVQAYSLLPSVTVRVLFMSCIYGMDRRRLFVKIAKSIITPSFLADRGETQVNTEKLITVAKGSVFEIWVWNV